MPHIQANLFIFDRLLVKKSRVLHAHLKSLEIGYESWAVRWFMTLFTYSERFPVVVRIWDCFLVEGITFLHKVALSLVKSLKTPLLRATQDTVLPILSDGTHLTMEVVKKARKMTFTG
jgi:hypothetical protein